MNSWTCRNSLSNFSLIKKQSFTACSEKLVLKYIYKHTKRTQPLYRCYQSPEGCVYAKCVWHFMHVCVECVLRKFHFLFFFLSFFKFHECHVQWCLSHIRSHRAVCTLSIHAQYPLKILYRVYWIYDRFYSMQCSSRITTFNFGLSVSLFIMFEQVLFAEDSVFHFCCAYLLLLNYSFYFVHANIFDFSSHFPYFIHRQRKKKKK